MANNIFKFLPADFKLDPMQLVLLDKLESVAKFLDKKSLLDFFRPNYKKAGIYLYGGVGRGKTMLMRSFCSRLTNVKAQVVHYQEFVLSVHKNMHLLQGQNPNRIISKLAQDYFSEFDVICLDEFEIKDITDAMLITRLFAELVKRKVFVFITSNTKPDDLYKDGLQRESFVPFIDMLNKQFDILYLDSGHDYRFDKLSKLNSRVLYPIDRNIRSEIKKTISDLTGDRLKTGSITVFGRDIFFARVYQNILVTDFDELFMREFGYVDYVNICQIFTVIIIENIPKIADDNNDLATRFINFIDNAYFHHVLLFVSMVDRPENIYKGIKRAQEFQRTISRLQEMNSDSYLELVCHELQ